MRGHGSRSGWPRPGTWWRFWSNVSCYYTMMGTGKANDFLKLLDCRLRVPDWRLRVSTNRHAPAWLEAVPELQSLGWHI